MVLITGARVEATTDLVSMWVGQRMGVWELPAAMVASLLCIWETGVGDGHAHPQGKFMLCFALDHFTLK